MGNLKKSIRFQLLESKNFILSLWGIILLVNIAFYILNNNFRNSMIGMSIGITDGIDNVSVVGSNFMIILVTLIVYNYVRNYESFPLSITLGMTRKNYFLSFLGDNIFISFLFAIIQGILLKIDPIIVKYIGRSPIYDFKYFNTSTDNIFYIIFIIFIIFLGIISFWSLIASLNYKFGYIIWIIFGGANIIISFFKVDYLMKPAMAIWEIIDPRLGVGQILTILMIIAGMYMVNYFLVIRSDIKKGI